MAFALEGIKVIETAQALAAPIGGRLLADLGANVIHIEQAKRGDIARGQSRFANITTAKRIASDIDYLAQVANGGKRSMTLDLSLEDGRKILFKLLENADVLLSNFRPREIKKFNLEYDVLSKLNPRLIHANLTGWGTKGPDKDAPGYENTSYFPRTGILHCLQLPGGPPGEIHTGLGDNIGGMALAFGVMSALFVRERTGVGQVVDTSLFQTGLFAISVLLTGSAITGKDWQQTERKDYFNPLNCLYETKDGRWLRIEIPGPDPHWHNICRTIEREDIENDPRFVTFEKKVENHSALFAILEEAFAKKTLAEWKARLDPSGLCWSPGQTLPEVLCDPQVKANNFLIPVDHPSYGRLEMIAAPFVLSKTPATIRDVAPEFGQHTEEILLEYGYTWEDIERFKDAGVIA